MLYEVITSDYHWGREGGETVAPGYIQRGYANPEVHWETNISRDIGFDLTLFKGLLTATFDAYYNSKKDMLLPVSLAPSTGTCRITSYNVCYTKLLRSYEFTQFLPAAGEYTPFQVDFEYPEDPDP